MCGLEFERSSRNWQWISRQRDEAAERWFTSMHSGSVFALAFSLDGLLNCLRLQRQVSEIVERRQVYYTSTPTGHEEAVSAVAFTESGSILTSSCLIFKYHRMSDMSYACYASVASSTTVPVKAKMRTRQALIHRQKQTATTAGIDPATSRFVAGCSSG